VKTYGNNRKRNRIVNIERRNIGREEIVSARQKISDLLPFILIGVGFMMMIFSVWQFDIMWVNRMWGPLQGNIDFFSSLIAQGFQSWHQAPFTINFELFPNMTYGGAYDLLTAMNILSWFFTASGAYLLNRRYSQCKKALQSAQQQKTS
jgi:hypothetical protein